MMEGTVTKERRKDKNLVDEKRGKRSAHQTRVRMDFDPNHPSFLSRRRFVTT